MARVIPVRAGELTLWPGMEPERERHEETVAQAIMSQKSNVVAIRMFNEQRENLKVCKRAYERKHGYSEDDKPSTLTSEEYQQFEEACAYYFCLMEMAGYGTMKDAHHYTRYREWIWYEWFYQGGIR